MTDLKPEDLRERAASYRMDGPSSEHTAKMLDDAADRIDTLLADRARMEKALDHALAALVNVTVNWGSTPDDDDAEGWCGQADTKRSVAQTALAQLGWGIDWNAIGRGEKDPAKLLKALGASQ